MNFLKAVFFMICFAGTSVLGQLPVVVSCKLTSSGATFKAKGKDCTQETQKAVCDSFKNDPVLGPSAPAGCKTFTSADELAKDLIAASDTRKNPIPELKGPIPHAVICALKTPKAGKSYFAMLSPSCDQAQAQAQCDLFKDIPSLGAATAIPQGLKVFGIQIPGCTSFASAEEVAAWTKTNTANGIYPGPGPLPYYAIKCALKTPKEGKSSFVTLGQSSDKTTKETIKAEAQTQCDMYKEVPFLGPATATPQNQFASAAELTDWIKTNTDDGSFPGMGGAAVTCKTRTQKITYKESTGSCSKEDQEHACQTKKGIADAISCTEHVTDRQLNDDLATNPKKYGVECQLNTGGSGYRVIVPECSTISNNEVCNPKDSELKSCTLFPDAASLTTWAKTYINEAAITCATKGSPRVIYTVPGRDCSQGTGRKVCGGFATAIACDKVPIEKLRQQAAQDAQK